MESQSLGRLGLLAALAALLLMPASAVAETLQVETAGSSCPSFNPASPELCGTISLPGGGDVRYYFELGTSPSYGQQIPAGPGTEINISPGESTVKVTVQLGGLQPSTTYHYRLAVSDDDGTHFGSDATFATPAAGGTLQVETAGPRCPPINPESMELCGFISLPGGGDVHYYFQVGTLPGSGEQFPAAPGGEISISPDDPEVMVRTKVSGLAPDTLYHYRLAVSDGEGTKFGGDATFTTPPAPAEGGGTPIPEVTAPVLNVTVPTIDVVTPTQPLTKAQQLARALKQCQRRPRQWRTACEKRIRKRYGAARTASTRG